MIVFCCFVRGFFGGGGEQVFEGRGLRTLQDMILLTDNNFLQVVVHYFIFQNVGKIIYL